MSEKDIATIRIDTTMASFPQLARLRVGDREWSCIIPQEAEYGRVVVIDDVAQWEELPRPTEDPE